MFVLHVPASYLYPGLPSPRCAKQTYFIVLRLSEENGRPAGRADARRSSPDPLPSAGLTAVSGTRTAAARTPLLNDLYFQTLPENSLSAQLLELMFKDGQFRSPA